MMLDASAASIACAALLCKGANEAGTASVGATIGGTWPDASATIVENTEGPGVFWDFRCCRNISFRVTGKIGLASL
jgi:hypothetical protein